MHIQKHIIYVCRRQGTIPQNLITHLKGVDLQEIAQTSGLFIIP